MEPKLTQVAPLALGDTYGNEVRLHADGDCVTFDLSPVVPLERDDLVKLRDWLNLVLADSAEDRK